jgi:transcription initiation factor TFIID subunit 2
MGEMKASAKEQESLLIEEDGSITERAKEAKKTDVETMIKVLRKDREVGKNEALREFLMPIALYVIFSSMKFRNDPFFLSSAPDVDQEVRWGIIKLADILIRGAEEVAPKVTIHLPPTPVQETPPPPPTAKVPTAKVPLKAQRPAPKTNGPPGRSPLVPFAPPKLKLPRITSTADVKTPVTDQATSRVAFAPSKPPSKAKGRQPKSDKNNHVPKAQSSGMSLNDLRACRSALRKIKPHKHAILFLEPVDPVRNHAPKFVDKTVSLMFPFSLTCLHPVTLK